ncbi:MAG: large conductance mechanosensitive channel protein MscL [Weeksellaceae bacterium]|nr:large conductance mechanosensitive channel protein MscL [Weeksellaceae bacterium]
MKKFFSEFRNFAVKGNMVDMAIGIIIGAAFNNALQSLVNKIMMPPLNLLTDGVNLENKQWLLRPEILGAEGEVLQEQVAIEYGDFLSVFVDFLLVALVVFLVVKVMNQLRKKSEDTKDKAVETPANVQLLSDLKVLMEEQNALLKHNYQNRI